MAYTPGEVPITFDSEWLREELQNIAIALQAVENVQLVELHAEPSRPREGLVVLADGIDWDPDATGNGGFFGYFGGSWTKLG